MYIDLDRICSLHRIIAPLHAEPPETDGLLRVFATAAEACSGDDPAEAGDDVQRRLNRAGNHGGSVGSI